MNGKELLEGLGHIDDRFVEEAGQRPQARRWAVLAACLCLLTAGIWSGWNRSAFSENDLTRTDEVVGDTAAAVDVSPAETVETVGALLQSVQYVRTESAYLGDQKRDSQTTLLSTLAELEGYSGGLGTAFAAACEAYDEDYFAAHDLLVLALEEPSGSIRHEVLSLRPGEKGWVIDLRTIVPEVGTMDLAQWHILMELSKGQIQKDDPIVVEAVK